jgi:hypothetical protein
VELHDLTKTLEKIKQKENILPEEVSSPTNFSKDLPDDFCIPKDNVVQDARYLKTENYKDEGFSKPENRLLKVDLVKNEAGVTEAHGFMFNAHSMGNVFDGVKAGEKVDNLAPVTPRRNWDINFSGRSHQMDFLVTDWPVLEDKDPKNSEVKTRYNSANLTETRYLFFPRKVTPSISRVDNELLMTLPTGESVLFDAASRRVISGAFNEKRRADAGKNASFTSKDGSLRTYYKPDSDLAYEGKGVWIETKATFQKNEADDQTLTIRTGSPSCKGDGCASCKVPSADIYEKKGGGEKVPSCRWFKFKTDEEFDAYLKSKCKFSLPSL